MRRGESKMGGRMNLLRQYQLREAKKKQQFDQRHYDGSEAEEET